MDDQMHSIAYEHSGGYHNRWELLCDLFAMLDYRLYLYYKYHSWLGPESDMRNMLGIVVSREEFEHNLVNSAQTGLCSRISADEAKELDDTELHFAARRKASDINAFPLFSLLSSYDFDEFEEKCIITAYIASVDKKYEKLFAYLSDDITKKNPTVALAVQLYVPQSDLFERYMSIFAVQSVFTSLFDESALKSGNLKLTDEVSEFLAAGKLADKDGRSFFDGTSQSPEFPLVINIDEAEALADAFISCENSGESVIRICGAAGCGKRLQLRHLAKRYGLRITFFDAQTSGFDVPTLRRAAVAAMICRSYLCITGLYVRSDNAAVNSEDSDTAEYTRSDNSQRFDKFTAAIRALDAVSDILFVTSEQPLHDNFGRIAIDISIPSPTLAQRKELFSAYFGDSRIVRQDNGAEVDAGELAAKFAFSPRQIMETARAAISLDMLSGGDGETLSSALVHKSAYMQVISRLDRLADKIPARYSWDDVVMPAEQLKLMREACLHIRCRHLVYDEWGFGEKLNYGTGLSMLFAGAPGTGKTMCAQVIARELDMELYKIRIPKIISKYIGETEKNLAAVFDEARNCGAVLFFDECDAIFGKRSEVKDSHDRSSNIEVAYLLQQIEEYDGVCILATNLLKNIDSAFMRRITYVVHFPFPDEEMRREIYLRTLPKNLPLAKDVDFGFLAKRINLSGGHIKNIVLNAAFLAAGENSAVTMRHLVSAGVSEMRKNEIVVVREDFGEYADYT